jgi:aspartate 1-decarboxylase
MFTQMIKSKIHRATVTDGDLNYHGSITICRKLMEAAELMPFEYVHVNNINNAAHWETYVIPGNT